MSIPLSRFKLQLANALSTINENDTDNVLSTLSQDDLLYLFAVPNSTKSGDLCIQLGKLNKFRLTFDKMELTKHIIDALQSCECVTSAQADGNYINIFLDQTQFAKAVITDVLQGQPFKKRDIGNGKTVYVEYSSPNIAKPFHVGHLRSTIIGSFVCKIHQRMGYNVIAENYLGDWGKQYGLLALSFELYGESEQLEKHPIKHLFELYVRINKEAKTDETVHERAREYFKKMELGDTKYLLLWQKMRELSISEYQKIYTKLGVEFDLYGGESMHSAGVKQQLDMLHQKQLLSNVDGAQIVKLQGKGMTNALIVKKDGSTLYITRDIAAAVSRWEKHKFEKMYYVVAVPQTLHFKQLFNILQKMGYEWSNRCKHIPFGLVKGMSTRKGDVVFLTDVIDEAKEVMLQQMKDSKKTKISEIEDPDKTAEMIGMSSIFIGDMHAKRIKDYVFDWNRITSFEGDTGPYVQYAHARLCGIERKANKKRGWDIRNLKSTKISYEKLTEPECRSVLCQICLYSNVIDTSFKTLEPSVIVQYLYGLCHAVSSSINVLNVINSKDENTGKARLALFHCVRLTIGDALALLGLKPLEKM